MTCWSSRGTQGCACKRAHHKGVLPKAESLAPEGARGALIARGRPALRFCRTGAYLAPWSTHARIKETSSVVRGFGIGRPPSGPPRNWEPPEPGGCPGVAPPEAPG